MRSTSTMIVEVGGEGSTERPKRNHPRALDFKTEQSFSERQHPRTEPSRLPVRNQRPLDKTEIEIAYVELTCVMCKIKLRTLFAKSTTSPFPSSSNSI
jgi:hypothetical protein